MATDSIRDDEEDAAVRWAIRLDGDPLAEDEQRSLDAWIEAEPRRRGSLLRAEGALSYLDRGRALADPRADAAEFQLRIGRRTFLVGGSISLAAIGLVGFFTGRVRPTVIGTAIGEMRRVKLADGSVASINTNSQVAVTLINRRREVTLEDGEAWFQVAHDRKRPFIVGTGSVRVEAVGTAFAVRRRPGGADVLVTEGLVEAWVVGRENKRVRIAAGSKSFIGDMAPTIEVVHASADIDRALAWRTGELALDGESLSFAVAELNRYNSRKLLIDDANLGREPLVGYFRTDQPENFSRAVASTVGAKIVVEGDTIHLTR